MRRTALVLVVLAAILGLAAAGCGGEEKVTATPETVEGVVTTYNKPFSKTDHEAITANIPVFGEVKGGKVVYAYPEDQKKASVVQVKK